MVKWIFRIVFLSICIYQIIAYLEYRRVIANDIPVHYTYVDKEIKRGGRGNPYQMAVVYNGRKFTVNITSGIYVQIDENKLPSLYYSPRRDVVFSLWEKKRAMRIALLFMAAALVTMIPFHKFLKKRANQKYMPESSARA